MHVLVVDDESFIADFVCTVIETEFAPATVRAVGSLRDALEALSRETFHAAVLDANLDGFSASPIAEALQLQGAPYFVISGSISQRLLPPPLDRAKLLAKPFRKRQLMECLVELMQRAALRAA